MHGVNMNYTYTGLTRKVYGPMDVWKQWHVLQDVPSKITIVTYIILQNLFIIHLYLMQIDYLG